MAEGINKVTPNIKITIITTPSLLDCVDNNEVEKVDESEFTKFVSKLKGESKKHFVALLEQLGEANEVIQSHEDTISKMEGHSRDYADEIADLTSALKEEQDLQVTLVESRNVDQAKLQKYLDHAIVLTRVLKSEKAELGVGHARLKEEFDTLANAHKS